eukprot:s2545_g6.t1
MGFRCCSNVLAFNIMGLFGGFGRSGFDKDLSVWFSKLVRDRMVASEADFAEGRASRSDLCSMCAEGGRNRFKSCYHERSYPKGIVQYALSLCKASVHGLRVFSFCCRYCRVKNRSVRFAVVVQFGLDFCNGSHSAWTCDRIDCTSVLSILEHFCPSGVGQLYLGICSADVHRSSPV